MAIVVKNTKWKKRILSFIYCTALFEDIKWSYIFLFVLDIASLYLNSIFTVPLYNNGMLIGITHASNFFSSYQNPLHIQMTNKNAYLIYMCIRFVGVVIIITLLYLPLLKRQKITIETNKVRKGKK